MEYKRKIFGYECDVYGHLNNANYLHLYEEARANALDLVGMSVEELNKNGLQIYVTEIQLKYIKGLPIGENVIVKSNIIKSTRATFIWEQKIIDSTETICNIAMIKGAFIKNGKPTRLSKEIFAKIMTKKN